MQEPRNSILWALFICPFRHFLPPYLVNIFFLELLHNDPGQFFFPYQGELKSTSIFARGLDGIRTHFSASRGQYSVRMNYEPIHGLRHASNPIIK